MRTRFAGLVVAFLALSPVAARADGLTVGDPAPALTVSKWFKGEKVDKLDKGQVYVVEFWATWCGPCRATIPHLTKLQKEYESEGVKFIGVSVFENDPKKVEPFVKEMGDKMDYRVATDDTSGGDNGRMASAWMKAAEEPGIPTAFIIGKDGKIAWIGHPSAMDGPLAKVVDGTWDLKAASSERSEMKAGERAMMQMGKTLNPLLRDKAKNGKAIVEMLDKAIADNAAVEKYVGSLKYEAMLYSDPEAAASYGAKLVDSTFKDDESSLNYIAWANVDPDAKLDDSKRDVKLALRAAQRASDLGKGENYAILDTLALATFLNGDPAKALEIQEKAVKLMPQRDDAMTGRLEKYRKAADKK